jgi:SAM-dependent methyltransferase
VKTKEAKQSSILALENTQNNFNQMNEVNPMLYTGGHYDLIHNNNQFFAEGIPDDISFWLNMASQYGGSILALFCGAGRVAIPLAEKGYQVTGLDISGSMLEEARKRSTQVEWVKADASNFELNQKFSLIVIPVNSITHLLELEALENCLKCIRNHLEPNGRLVIDFENFCSQENIDFFSSKVRQPYSVYPDPDGKGIMVVTCETELDLFEQICKLKLFFKLLGQTEEVCEDVILRFYSAKEFETLLKYNGFVVEQRFGNCDRTPFTAQSPRHLLVCYPQK